MKRFKYIGPHDAVDLTGVGTVEHGHTVEVEDPEISKGLEGQADWEHIPDPKKSAAAKAAAQKED